MQTLLVFVWVYAAMVATAFWEAYVEGRHPWDKGKLGWKIHYRGRVILTAYHFWLFVVMFPFLLSLPFIIIGRFDFHLFGIIISAYTSGLVVEDFFWFVANPLWGLKNWRPEKVHWYPWLRIGKFQIPTFYAVSIIIAFLSWLFIWRV